MSELVSKLVSELVNGLMSEFMRELMNGQYESPERVGWLHVPAIPNGAYK